MDRRAFVETAAAGLCAATLPIRVGTTPERAPLEPWLEIDPAALRRNVREISRLAGGRPILAVVKNNAYGLGLATVAPILEPLGDIAGFAVVKPAEAESLRAAGVRKPVLYMGLFDEDVGAALAAQDVTLAPYTSDAPQMLARLSTRLKQQIPVHLYIDTGLSRLGRPFRVAAPWIAELAGSRSVRIDGMFMTFTESDEFDPIQIERFTAVATQARHAGIHLGQLHAASSHPLFLRPAALFDMVRPGLSLYGARPSEVPAGQAAGLTPAFRLKASVVRVERLEPGDGVSYGRGYVASRPVWVAALPVGHADGYPRGAVQGCEVLIRGRRYRAIGAVSASHTIVEVGAEKTVDVGDEAILVGPDDEAIHPNTVAARAGVSVYDILMHLSQGLPRRTS